MNFAQSLGGLSIWMILWGASPLKAQSFRAQDWTEANQTYLRIPIAKTGFYQVPRGTLALAGLPVDTIYTKAYRLFRRGKQVPLEIRESEDGAFASLGFYAEKNDGRYESDLYLRSEYMPHPYYSLYTDTAAYFLAWYPHPEPARRIPISTTQESEPQVGYHFQETLKLLTTDYPAGQFYPPQSGYNTGSVRTEYDLGEGWTGPEIKKGNSFTLNIPTDHAMLDPDSSTTLRLLLVGRSAGLHNLNIYAYDSKGSPRLLGKVQWNDYNTMAYETLLGANDFSNSKELRLELVSAQGSASLSYAWLRYAQTSLFDANDDQRVCHFASGSKSWRFTADASWQFYDIGNSSAPVNIQPQNGLLSLNGSPVLAVAQPYRIPTPRMVQFPAQDLSTVDYLIVTHPTLRKLMDGKDAVTAYAQYRRSTAGGQFKVHIMNIEEVADRYHFGERGPSGLRNLIASLPSLKYVFIIGRSIDPQTARRSAKAQSMDLIPNAGWPGSDLALATHLHENGVFTPLVPIGRLNTDQPSQVLDYLMKVQSMEAQPHTAAWRKRILHLSGGHTLAERSVFREYVDSFADTIRRSDFSPFVSTISKQSEQATEAFQIDEPVNEGVALLTLFGHTGLNRTDIDIGLASDLRRHYRNHPYYPALLVNGCAIGNIFFGQPTLINDWILAKEKGAVLSIGHTHNGLTAQLKHYSDSFYAVLADSTFRSRGFGDIQLEAIKRNLSRYPNLLDEITCMQMNLQGDPAIRIFPATQPDYAWELDMLQISSPSLRTLTANSDSIRLQASIINYGRYRPDSLSVEIRRLQNGRLIQKQTLRSAAPSQRQPIDLTFPSIIKTGGSELWTLQIDPDRLISETDTSNNQLAYSWQLRWGGAQPLWPETGFLTSAASLRVVAQTTDELPEGNMMVEWSTDSTFLSSNTKSRMIQSSNYVASTLLNLPLAATVYWRVWMVADSPQPSTWRSITQQQSIAEQAPLLPEGIAFSDHLPKSTFLEGEPFTAFAYFKNVAPIAFQDSIRVKQTLSHQERNWETYYTLSQLAALDLAVLPITVPTIGKVGKNRLKIEFNSSQLPELNHQNNIWYHEFEVVPDLLAPQIFLHIDGRQIENHENIAPSALFQIRISDNNLSRPPLDTSAVLIYLSRYCQGCYPQRMYFTKATWQLLQNGILVIQLKPLQPLAAGSYMLQVYAQDRSFNWANAYEINFTVGSTPAIRHYKAYPNPAASWFCFEVSIEGERAPSGWTIEIWNALGKSVAKSQSTVHIGINRWIWWPQGLSTGSYWYRIQLNDPDTILTNTQATGRLVYNP